MVEVPENKKADAFGISDKQEKRKTQLKTIGKTIAERGNNAKDISSLEETHTKACDECGGVINRSTACEFALPSLRFLSKLTNVSGVSTWNECFGLRGK